MLLYGFVFCFFFFNRVIFVSLHSSPHVMQMPVGFLFDTLTIAITDFPISDVDTSANVCTNTYIYIYIHDHRDRLYKRILYVRTLSAVDD